MGGYVPTAVSRTKKKAKKVKKKKKKVKISMPKQQNAIRNLGRAAPKNPNLSEQDSIGMRGIGGHANLTGMQSSLSGGVPESYE
jgi:hypothetical protein